MYLEAVRDGALDLLPEVAVAGDEDDRVLARRLARGGAEAEGLNEEVYLLGTGEKKAERV